MKERRTYFLHEGAEYHPDDITVRQNSLSVKGLNAAKEIRRTFTLGELPEEVRKPATVANRHILTIAS